MKLECGGHKGHWMKIVDFDTSTEDGYLTGLTNNARQFSIDICMYPSNKPGYYATILNSP